MASTVAERGSRAGVLAWARAIPAWAWLVGLVVVSAAIRYALGRQIVAPWIMVDELIYSELAKSFAATGHFLVRDQAIGGYGIVYPLIVSPAWRAFGSVPDAYTAAKALNAVLMSLAAVPAYLVARRILSSWLSLAAAALAVAVPSMLYTGTLMTENAFYPLFLLVVWVLLLVLERPTVYRQLGLLALCALAYATRPQAVALVAAAVTAPVLLAVADRDLRGLRRYVPAAAVLVGAFLVLVAAQVARGHSLTDALGAYAAAGQHSYDVGQGFLWFLYHLAELALYVVFVPALALILLVADVRSLPARGRAFVVATVSLVFWVTLLVAFVSELAVPRRIEERYLFYLAPLLVIALLYWIDRGMTRTRVALASGSLLLVVLAAFLPWRRMIDTSATSDTLAAIPWWRLQETVVSFGWVRPLVAVLAAVACALVAFLPRRLGWVLPLLVVVSYAVVAQFAQSSPHGFHQASLGSLWAGIRKPQLDWVDRAVGRNADVAAVWSGRTEPHTIWTNEFFNRSIGPVYDLGVRTPGGLPETTLHPDRATGYLLDANGRRVKVSYVLADGSLSSSGTVVASDPRQGIALYRVNGDLRSLVRVSGVYADSWSGPLVGYTRFDCHGGRLTVGLASDPSLFDVPTMVTAVGVGGRVLGRSQIAPSGTASLTVPLRPTPAGTCPVRFAVSPTRVPGPSDPRRLGAHFTSFVYTP